MKKLILISFLFIGLTSQAGKFDENIFQWKDEPLFSEPEKNFKAVVRKLLESHVDSSLREEDLYRAATAGMLSALNTGEENWNRLLSPREYQDLQIEMSGKVTGIGATLSFDGDTGHAKVLVAIPGSAAEKAELQPGDLILSVDGKTFKGKSLAEMVSRIRGPAGKSVEMKVLRGEQILPFKITRTTVEIGQIRALSLNESAALLQLGAFTQNSPEEVRQALAKLGGSGLKKLIIDLRGNTGGGFDQVIQVAEFFSPAGKAVAHTVGRSGKKDYVSKGVAWNPNAKIIVLIDKDTFSGAELLAAALKENRGATLIGQKTHGKWSAQSVDELANHFYVKYSVMNFQSPSGKSYQGKGLPPDFEVTLPSQEPAARWAEKDPQKLLEKDPQLRAALEL